MVYNPNTYTADGSTTEFAITFPFLREADVAVSVFDASGNAVSAFDFEIFLDGSFKARVVADGTITDNTPTPLPVNFTVTVSRATDISTLSTTFVDGVSLRAADINLLLNQQNYALQEFGRNTQEALGKNVTDTAWDATSLRITNLAQPTANNDAVRKVDVDSGIGPAITTVAGIASDVTAVVADQADIGVVSTDLSGSNTIGTVAGSIANVNTVGGAIANVNAVAADQADIGVVATDLAGSDTIGTVAGSIANVNTLAGVSSDVTSLAPQASNIGTLATGTDSGGTAYLTHLANAATNAAAANAALNAFNATYVGAYASDPSVDANGNALTDGDLYYDTTNQRLKFFDAANGTWITLANSVQVNSASTLQAVGDVDFANAGGPNLTLAANHFIVRDSTNGRWENTNAAGVRSLLNVEDGATADQTGAEIKTALFNETGTNNLNDTLLSDLQAALQPGDVIDNLTSTSTTAVLSAAQGKALNDSKQANILTTTALAAASLTTVTDAGNTVDVRRADRIAQASSVNVDGGATLYDVTATATLTLSDLVAGDIVTLFSRSGTTTIARGTITYAYIDGDIATNKTSVTVGAGTLATVTMVSNDTAIIAGSDLT